MLGNWSQVEEEEEEEDKTVEWFRVLRSRINRMIIERRRRNRCVSLSISLASLSGVDNIIMRPDQTRYMYIFAKVRQSPWNTFERVEASWKRAIRDPEREILCRVTLQTIVRPSTARRPARSFDRHTYRALYKLTSSLSTTSRRRIVSSQEVNYIQWTRGVNIFTMLHCNWKARILNWFAIAILCGKDRSAIQI